MKCTEEIFLKDVARHEMTIIRDEGLHRHLRFKRPDESDMHFDIVTWPGYLAYTGDMGCYVFQRTGDMLSLFRNGRNSTDDNTKSSLYTNPSYWGEKLQAYGRNGYRVYSEEVFKDRVKAEFSTACEYIEDQTRHAELWSALEDEVLSSGETEESAYAALMNFDHKDLSFSDVFEWNLTEFSFHFLWCCFALSWAVDRYDEKASAQIVCE